MSQISKETINKVAKLANIKFSDAEKEQFAASLTKITNWVGTLDEVNTDNVEPLNNVHNAILTMFPDVVEENNNAEEVLKNAPEAKYNYFTVPKVIE